MATLNYHLIQNPIEINALLSFIINISRKKIKDEINQLMEFNVEELDLDLEQLLTNQKNSLHPPNFETETPEINLQNDKTILLPYKQTHSETNSPANQSLYTFENSTNTNDHYIKPLRN